MSMEMDASVGNTNTQMDEPCSFHSCNKVSASRDEILVGMFAEVFGPKGAAYLALEFDLRCPPEIQRHLAEVEKTVSAYRKSKRKTTF